MSLDAEAVAPMMFSDKHQKVGSLVHGRLLLSETWVVGLPLNLGEHKDRAHEWAEVF